MRMSLVFHVDDSLLAGTHQIITEILTEIEPTPAPQKLRGDDKTDALPGTNPSKDEGQVELRS